MNIPSITSGDLTTPLRVNFPKKEANYTNANYIKDIGNRILSGPSSVRELVKDGLQITTDEYVRGPIPLNAMTNEAALQTTNIKDSVKQAKNYAKFIPAAIAVVAVAGLAVKHFIIDKKAKNEKTEQNLQQNA